MAFARSWCGLRLYHFEDNTVVMIDVSMQLVISILIQCSKLAIETARPSALEDG